MPIVKSYHRSRTGRYRPPQTSVPRHLPRHATQRRRFAALVGGSCPGTRSVPTCVGAAVSAAIP